MPDLGRKYTCYSCHTKFYDLGRNPATCPKCSKSFDPDMEFKVSKRGRGRTADDPFAAIGNEKPAPKPRKAARDEDEYDLEAFGDVKGVVSALRSNQLPAAGAGVNEFAGQNVLAIVAELDVGKVLFPDADGVTAVGVSAFTERL